MISPSLTDLHIFYLYWRLSNLCIQSRLLSNSYSYIQLQTQIFTWSSNRSLTVMFFPPNLPHLQNHLFSWKKLQLSSSSSQKILVSSFDISLSFKPTIQSVSKSHWLYLQNKSRIWPLLPILTAKTWSKSPSSFAWISATGSQ